MTEGAAAVGSPSTALHLPWKVPDSSERNTGPHATSWTDRPFPPKFPASVFPALSSENWPTLPHTRPTALFVHFHSVVSLKYRFLKTNKETETQRG